MARDTTAINQQNTADNLIGTSDTQLILKRSAENIKSINGPEKIVEVNYSGVGQIVFL